MSRERIVRTLQMYNYFRPKIHQTIPKARQAQTINGHQESERKNETSKAGIRNIAKRWNLPWCSFSFIEANDLVWSDAIVQVNVVAIDIIDGTKFFKKVKTNEDAIWSTFA